MNRCANSSGSCRSCKATDIEHLAANIGADADLIRAVNLSRVDRLSTAQNQEQYRADTPKQECQVLCAHSWHILKETSCQVPKRRSNQVNPRRPRAQRPAAGSFRSRARLITDTNNNETNERLVIDNGKDRLCRAGFFISRYCTLAKSSGTSL